MSLSSIRELNLSSAGAEPRFDTPFPCPCLDSGGTRGIGANLALALAKAGADIILIQRSGASCMLTSNLKAS